MGRVKPTPTSRSDGTSCGRPSVIPGSLVSFTERAGARIERYSHLESPVFHFADVGTSRLCFDGLYAKDGSDACAIQRMALDLIQTFPRASVTRK